MTDIYLEHVSYTYSSGTPFEYEAIKDLTMRFEGGFTTGLIGHTGSGKSTIAQMLNGLLRPTDGKVFVGGQDIWENAKDITKFRFRVGLVFQYPEYQLFEETVYADIAFGPKNMGLSKEEIQKRVEEAAQFAGIGKDLLFKSPFELSGGQKRRVAIAGVMAMSPDVMVLDEPAAGLDPRGREEILGGLNEYRRKKGNTMIIISHSMEDMALYSDRLYVLDHGKVAMYGTPKEVFSQATKLQSIGLNVPQVTEIAHALKQRGAAISDGIFTVSEAVQEILPLVR